MGFWVPEASNLCHQQEKPGSPAGGSGERGRAVCFVVGKLLSAKHWHGACSKATGSCWDVSKHKCHTESLLIFRVKGSSLKILTEHLGDSDAGDLWTTLWGSSH